MEFRNEIKFEVSDLMLERIRYRLIPIMEQDHHQDEEGYRVRSLYFDDLYDSHLRENEAGTDVRKKYRIRIYNGSAEVIHLEKKGKYRGMTHKDKLSVDLDWCKNYLSNLQDNVIIKEEDPLAEEFFYKIQSVGLHPKCIVEYDRYAFVEKIGNVRVTFDRNIRGSRLISSFLDRKIDTVPVMKEGHQILEVKYDEFLPQYILQVLDLGNLQKQSFSKYYITRAILG